MENITSFEWRAVSSEAALAVFAALTFLLCAALPARMSKAVSCFAMIGLAAALAVEIFSPAPALSFCGMLGGKSTYGVFALACALLTSLMAFGYFRKGARGGNEFLALVMVCAASLMLFVRAENLMLSFVALESATVCLYILAAWSRAEAASVEASIKYIVVGGVSGAAMLLGIAFIYGASLATGRELLCFSNFSEGLLNPMFRAGIVLVAGSALFKIAAFPFQFWSPDVYQGAPTPVSAFLAVASKAAGAVFLGKICLSCDFAAMGLGEIQDKAAFAVSVVAAATIIVGNLGGLTQVSAKRLVAFSGIANAGYILVLFAALLKYRGMVGFFEPVLYFYLAAYMFATYGIFFVVNGFEGMDDASQTFADYRGLTRKNPVLGGSLIVNLASLAGIPPTAGFFGKLLILIFAWYAQ
ncbi:MAG: hypothetical protein IJI37_02720, partial [Opitutales bacterium]|nr:hypothetical protein [Opitutales bacterium]